MNEDKTTTWGDCPDPSCPFYGRLKYNIEPGDTCSDHNGDRGCWEELRWWDRWHDGKHSGYNRDEVKCIEQRRKDAMKPHTDDMVTLVSDTDKALTSHP